MHEFGITERLFQVALNQADLQFGERIERLHIRLDPESGYAPDAIRFYFEQLAAGSVAEGANLEFTMAAEPHHIALAEVVVNEAEALKQPAPMPAPTDEPIVRWLVEISGVVQGVGFRPFVCNLAAQLGLNGWVCNTTDGVELALQGPAVELRHFLHHLRHDAPPLAHIVTVKTTPVPVEADMQPGLEIRSSRTQGGQTLISPDAATCPQCLAEIFDPLDRRADYPFTNCTHCGPRFTIITDLPYDRPRTTMADFSLCDNCEAEYINSADRRFHAQPIACPTCGPTLWYSGGQALAEPTAETPLGSDALTAAVKTLDQHGVIAVKGLGGFHLACRADDDLAVNRLRTRKKRPTKPLAVMVRNVQEAAQYGQVGPAEAALLLSPEAPIVLLRKQPEMAAKLSAVIAPQNGYIGLMLPYTPLHHLLLQTAGGPLVMTSGNRPGEPLCIDNAAAGRELGAICDGFLLHDRPIARPCDDSVMFVAYIDGEAIIQPVRRSRGLVPLPVLLPEAIAAVEPMVVTGADLKNVPALVDGQQVFLTQHIGDLAGPNNRAEHALALATFEQLFNVKPTVAVSDLHPDYAAHRYAQHRAETEGLQLLAVQHHHAHLAGCLAENNHLGPAIGLSFDGTGYGLDGCIWGGEVLLTDLQNFQRLYHLEYLPLPGGEVAIRRPARMAVGYLRTLLPDLNVQALLPTISAQEISVIDAMLYQQLNCPLTSSMGRLFDVVSALLGLCSEVTYEAEAAIALEAAALQSRDEGPIYAVELSQKQIKLTSLFKDIIADRLAGLPVPDIARRFHRTIARLALTAAQVGRSCSGRSGEPVKTVALSGGVWQNRLLLELTIPRLQANGFEVLVHHTVPANDGGLAYGQAAVAAARLRER
jgi:hydrogenase maturation protein HypF